MSKEQIDPTHEQYLQDFNARNVALAEFCNELLIMAQKVSTIITEDNASVAFEVIADTSSSMVKASEVLKKAYEYHKKSFDASKPQK